MNKRIAEARREKERITTFAPEFLRRIARGVGPRDAAGCVGLKQQVIWRYVKRVQKDIQNNTNDSSQEERDFFYAFREALRTGYAGLQARLKKKPTTHRAVKVVNGIKRKVFTTQDHADLARSHLERYPWEDLMERARELVGDELNPDPDKAWFGVPVVTTDKSLPSKEDGEDPLEDLDPEITDRGWRMVLNIK